MFIENPEALKAWLTTSLEPLCDADPAALSKYVLALIKKDKPLDDLKESMSQQMDVFLQAETKSFVENLFLALESKSYLEKTAESNEEAKQVEESIKQKTVEKENEGTIKSEQDIDNSGKPDSTTTTTTTEQVGDGRRVSGSGIKDGRRFKDDERGHRGRRTGQSPPPRDRSPTRRRYRRPISPPHGGQPNAGGNRRFRSRSPQSRSSRIRGRSPERYGRSGRSRSTSPDRVRRRSFSRSRSRSPTYSRSRIQMSPDPLGYVPSAKAPRCRDYDEKGFCMRGDQCKYDHGNDAVILADSVGAVPAYNPAAPSLDTSIPPPSALHTVPPPNIVDPYVPATSVIIDPNIPPPAATDQMPPLHLPPPGFPTPLHAPPPSHGQKRAFDSHMSEQGGYGPPAKRGFDFNRLGRGTRGGARGRGFRGRSGTTTQLAVRNIPPSLNNIGLLNNHFGKFGTLVNVQVHFEGDPASALITFSDPSEAESAINCADAVLANRFIKVFYHNSLPKNIKDRLGTSEHTDGKVELSGDSLTKTIVNQEATNSTSPQGVASDESKRAEKAAAIAAIKKNQEILEAKAQMKKAAQSKQTEAAKRMLDLRKGKQDLLDKQLAEQKKLIAKLESKKENGEELKVEEKTMIMKLIKTLSESIMKTKDDLQKMIHASTNKLSPSEIQKALLDAELELFTAQADGSDTSEIQKRVNSLTVECARQGILPTSRSPGSRGGLGRGGGRGYMQAMTRGSRGQYGRGRGYRGRGGRGNLHFLTSVDRRPSKIRIEGFDSDDKEAIIAQFRQFGEILETVDSETPEHENEIPSLVLHFKTRKEAELAMINGKKFGEQPLKLEWFTGTTPVDLQTQLSTEEGAGGAVSEVGSDILLADPDDDYQPLDPAYLPPGLEDDDNTEKDHSSSKLEYDETLLDEEEVDDDDEDERSWKR